MRTVDVLEMRAARAEVFRAASDVGQWPSILPHYRWVRFRNRRDDGGTVEMAAWRPFGPLRYPTWWVSEMWIDSGRNEVRYHHVDGITTGMDVVWKLEEQGDRTVVSIVHEWSGPRWPLVGRFAANAIIGPVFIHGIASRTLAGIRNALERPDA